MIAPDFQKGADGNPCAPLAVRIGVINDFNAHEPHVGVTGTLMATTSSSLVQERSPVIRMSTCDLRVPLVRRVPLRGRFRLVRARRHGIAKRASIVQRSAATVSG